MTSLLGIHQWAGLITENCLSTVLFPWLPTCLTLQWALLVAVTQMETQHNVVLGALSCVTVALYLYDP